MREQFGALLGTWTGLERQEASPWAPAADARASMVFKLDVADTAVVQDYRQVRDDGSEFTAHGVFLAEPGSARVLWWLFDSYAQPPVTAAGGWSEEGLVLEKTTLSGLARHHFVVDGHRLDYRIRVRLDGADAWSPFLAGRYRRVSGH